MCVCVCVCVWGGGGGVMHYPCLTETSRGFGLTETDYSWVVEDHRVLWMVTHPTSDIPLKSLHTITFFVVS